MWTLYSFTVSQSTHLLMHSSVTQSLRIYAEVVEVIHAFSRCDLQVLGLKLANVMSIVVASEERLSCHLKASSSVAR